MQLWHYEKESWNLHQKYYKELCEDSFVVRIWKYHHDEERERETEFGFLWRTCHWHMVGLENELSQRGRVELSNTIYYSLSIYPSPGKNELERKNEIVRERNLTLFWILPFFYYASSFIRAFLENNQWVSYLFRSFTLESWTNPNLNKYINVYAYINHNITNFYEVQCPKVYPKIFRCLMRSTTSVPTVREASSQRVFSNCHGMSCVV